MFAIRRSFTAGSTRAFAQRSFSAAADHQPPKKIFGVHGRYAGALFTAASKAGLLPKVEAEVLAVSDLLKKSPTFAAYLSNPTIPRAEKITKVGNLLSDSTKFSYITKNLFEVLCANGKVGEVKHVISAFKEMIDASKGSVKVTIIAAQSLSKKQLAAVQEGVIKIVVVESKGAFSVVYDQYLSVSLSLLMIDAFRPLLGAL
eukprot:gene30024-39214_t